MHPRTLFVRPTSFKLHGKSYVGATLCYVMSLIAQLRLASPLVRENCVTYRHFRNTPWTYFPWRLRPCSEGGQALAVDVKLEANQGGRVYD